jgi:hypothetical protein
MGTHVTGVNTVARLQEPSRLATALMMIAMDKLMRG